MIIRVDVLVFLAVLCAVTAAKQTFGNQTVMSLLSDMTKQINIIRTGMNSMATKQEIQQLKDIVLKSAADRHHEYVPEFAHVLEMASSSLNCSHNGTTFFSTEHSVYFDDYVFTIGAKHSKCYDLMSIRRLLLPDVDVIIRTGCPVSSHVLNVSTHVPLRTGDEASTLGYVNGVSRFWHGRLSGKLMKTVNDSGTLFHPDEYLFEGGLQIQGMSGGATLNGFGYTGMVHGLETHAYPAPAPHFAVVVPAQTILGTFDNQVNASIKGKYMKRLVDCPGVTVVQIPRF